MLVYFADLLTIRAHFDRYVLPLVPPLAVLAGRQRALAPLTLGLLIVPLVWAIGDDVRLTRTDTRVVAQRWIVAHLPARRIGRRRLLDAADRPARRSTSSCPARAGRTTRTGTWPGCEARAWTTSSSPARSPIASSPPATTTRSEARFYDDLRTRAKRVYHVQSGHGLTGPWVSLYRL